MGRGPGPRVRLAVLPLNHAVRNEDGTVSTTNTALLDTRGKIKTGDVPTPLEIGIGSNGIVQSASQNTNVPSIIVSADGKYTLMMTTGDTSKPNPMNSSLRRFLLISNADLNIAGLITREDAGGNIIDAGMTFTDGNNNIQLSSSGNNLMGWKVEKGFSDIDIGSGDSAIMVNDGAVTANTSITSGSAAFVYVDKTDGGVKITGTELTATTNAASAAGTDAGGAVLAGGGSGQTWVEDTSIPYAVATATAGAEIFIPPRYPDAQIVSEESETIDTSSIDYIGGDVNNAAVRINTTEDAFIDVYSSGSTTLDSNVSTALIASANGVQGSSGGLAYVVSAVSGLDVTDSSWSTRVAIMAVGEIASSEGDVSTSYSGGALAVYTTEIGKNTITHDWSIAF